MTTQVLPIDSLMKEVSALIERELYQMLDKYMKNYKKYKKTYKHIMKLPVVRKLKDFKKINAGSKGNKSIVCMLVNQINELTAEISTLKTTLYTYEHDNGDERSEEENISLKITEPNVEDIVVDSGTKVYADLIENTQPQQTNSNITQTKVVKLDAVAAVVSEGESEDEALEEEEEAEEEEAAEEKEEDEEEVFEIEIDDKTYYTNNEENGIIYEALPNDEVGEKIGYLKDGEPFFTNIV
jgi:hypothetical protein